MKKLQLGQLTDLRYALDEMIEYLTDNSCSDPECCNGPYSTKKDFDDAAARLAKYGLEYQE
jgi:hypothetical protein